MDLLEEQTLKLFELMQQFHRQKEELAQQKSVFQGEMSILLFLCHPLPRPHSDLFTQCTQLNTHFLPDVHPTPSEISSGLNIPRPTVTVFLNSLEEKGYIRRQMKQQDRSSLEVSITPQGVELLRKKAEGILRRTQAVLKLLGEEDTASLLRILSRCVEILEGPNLTPDNIKGKEA